MKALDSGRALACAALTLALGAGVALPAQAAAFTVSIDTSAWAGTSAHLAFDFIDGGSPSNSVVISGFAGNGTLGAQSTSGDVLGLLPATLTLGDASFFDELLAGYTLGTTLSFTFEASQAAPDPGSVPDAFSLLLLDGSGAAALFDTTDPSGANALLQWDIDGSTGGGRLAVYEASAGAGVRVRITPQDPPQPQPVPEPGGWALAGIGLAALAAGRRQRPAPRSLNAAEAAR